MFFFPAHVRAGRAHARLGPRGRPPRNRPGTPLGVPAVPRRAAQDSKALPAGVHVTPPKCGTSLRRSTKLAMLILKYTVFSFKKNPNISPVDFQSPVPYRTDVFP